MFLIIMLAVFRILDKLHIFSNQWRIHYFWQSQFNFFTLYTMSKNIFKLNLDFIVAEIRVFGSVGVYVCV